MIATAEAPVLDERRWARLSWRCRRGMLENDLVLARYLDRVDRRIDERDMMALDALLDLDDNALWDLLSGRVAPRDEEMERLVRQLREPVAAPAATHHQRGET